MNWELLKYAKLLRAMLLCIAVGVYTFPASAGGDTSAHTITNQEVSAEMSMVMNHCGQIALEDIEESNCCDLGGCKCVSVSSSPTVWLQDTAVTPWVSTSRSHYGSYASLGTGILSEILNPPPIA